MVIFTPETKKQKPHSIMVAINIPTLPLFPFPIFKIVRVEKASSKTIKRSLQITITLNPWANFLILITIIKLAIVNPA